MVTPKDHFGFLYFATGKEHYLWEAIFSAVSARFHHPFASICLVTDWKVSGAVEGLFDTIKSTNELEIDTSRHPYRAKVDCLLRSPYERTLFLDTDTFLASPVFDITSSTSNHFALAPNLELDSFGNTGPSTRGGQTLYNTGVIFFTDKQIGNLSDWSIECGNREVAFKVPGIDSSGIRANVSIGDQNVFNDLYINRGWKINEFDAMRFNFKSNIFKNHHEAGKPVSDVKIFHLHNALGNLLNVGISSFNEIRLQFSTIRKNSSLAHSL